MTVIDFPGGARPGDPPPKRNPGRKTKSGPQVSRPDVPHNKIAMGPIRYSCPCGNLTEIHGSGVIFRTMDLYCLSCGLMFRITNPAFGR